MKDINNLITDNIHVWASGIKKRNSQGRGSNKKIELNGIKKLRELILELAVRGKLVSQDPNDEPSSALIEKTIEEKALLIADKKIKKQKGFPAILEQEKAFEAPNTWEYVRLGEIGNIFNGNSVNASLKESKYTGLKAGLPFIATKDVAYGFTPFDYENGVLIPVDEPKFKVARKDSVLICAEGGSAGKKCGIANQDICFGNKLFANELLAGINSEFILSVYLSPTFFSKFSESMTGIIGGISSANFSKLVISLPPLAEQQRIVAKINELMSLCDELEHQTEQSLNAHQTLVEILLNTLTSSDNTNDFKASWQRIADHFDVLFTTEHSIRLLKETILHLAVMGKLVPQNPSDEPVSLLLENIDEEKAQLFSDKKIKKQTKLSAITPQEKPFELPSNWKWCRIGDVGDIKLGRQRSPKDHNGPHMVPYLRVANVHDNRIDITDVKKMNFTPEEQKTFRLEYGDILLNEGQSKELVGRPAMFKNDVVGACFQNTLLRFKGWVGISSEYTLLYFRHCLYSKRFQKAVKQTTNMAHLSAGRLIPIEFPLPPSEEQPRIVAKVDELMLLCAQLKARLNDAQITQIHLADAVVEQALN